MREFLITVAAVLVAIGVGIGIIAAVWSSPSYRADGVVVTAAFPGKPRMARASVAGVQATAWAVVEGASHFAVFITPRGFLRLPDQDQSRLLVRIGKEAGAVFGVWVGYRPPTRDEGCGPLRARRVIDGKVAMVRYLGAWVRIHR